jgi:hypothetical protein
MEFALSMLNMAACGSISLLLLVAVLSPRVNDGVIVKLGLIVMCLGFGSVALRMADGSSAGDGIGLGRSMLLICAGIAVVMLGYLTRAFRAHHPLVRATDWSDLNSH